MHLSFFLSSHVFFIIRLGLSEVIWQVVCTGQRLDFPQFMIGMFEAIPSMQSCIVVHIH